MDNSNIFGLAPRSRREGAARPEAWLTITPLGGFGEIGMNCMLWSTPGARVIVDCGLMFPSDYHLGVDVIIPRFERIQEYREEILGIVLTHGHEDHIGALPWLMPHLRAPIYASPFTLALVEHKLREHGLLDACKLISVSPDKPVLLGDMRFHFFPAYHSIIDGYCLGVETPAGKVVHTGDFKLEQDPLEGPGTDLQGIRKFVGKAGAALLLSDSTNVERDGFSLTERDVLSTLRLLFGEARGRILVTLFSSHIQRIQEVFDCARETGRIVAVSGRSLVNNIEMAQRLGRLRPPEKLYLDTAAMPQVADNKLVLLVTGSQGEPLSALARISSGGHKHLSIHDQDTVIMSSRLIPGNTSAVHGMVNNLFRQGAEVYHDRDLPVHASGHAQRGELKEMLLSVRPRHFVPVHGEYRHLVKHRRLAVECGVDEDDAHIIEDGQPFTLTLDGFFLEEPIPAESIMVDGKGVGDVGQSLLKERRILGDEGMVVATVVLSGETWEILQGPELFSKGFVFEQQYSHILEEAAQVARESVQSSTPGDEARLKERLRASLRRFFRKILDRDPVLVPIVTIV
ncbi:MAG: ribonuclease J [Deltaproteobacteria bacterium]|jgi:ribonuclease J|nr:ribonuclease J [Deltaproteobacteria bacterium]